MAVRDAIRIARDKGVRRWTAGKALSGKCVLPRSFLASRGRCPKIERETIGEPMRFAGLGACDYDQQRSSADLHTQNGVIRWVCRSAAGLERVRGCLSQATSNRQPMPILLPGCS